MPRLPIYEQQTSPDLLPTSQASRTGLVDNTGAALQGLGAAMGQATDTVYRVEQARAQERKRQEDEDARVWTMNTMADATLKEMQRLAEMQDSAESGAPDFTKNYVGAFDEYEQTLYSIAPNETSKKFLRERMLALRVDMTTRASSYERQERARWRVSSVESAIKNTADAAAMDPTRVPVMIAEQKAVIEALDAPPEQRRALIDKLVSDTSMGAVLGEIERDPQGAQKKLFARLGLGGGEGSLESYLRAEGVPEAQIQEMVKAEQEGRDFTISLSPDQVQAAMESNPNGTKTGDMSYDNLTVPQVTSLLGKVQSELGRRDTEMKNALAARETDDLAAFSNGKQPDQLITRSEFIAAFGPDEGARRANRYESGQGFASQYSGLLTKTPGEIEQQLKAMEPKAGEGYAAKQAQFENFQRAAAAVVSERNKDPIAFAIQNFNVAPLDFSSQDVLGQTIAARVGVAQTNARKYGTPYTLLSVQEKEQLGTMFKNMTAGEKTQMFETLTQSVRDPYAYQSIMADLKQTDVVTANAGGILGVSNDEYGRKSSREMLAGLDAIKAGIKMPSETDLEREFNSRVGGAYAGNPQARQGAFESFKALVAAQMSSSGVNPTELASEAKGGGGQFGKFADYAAERATGGVVEINDSSIVAPYGFVQNGRGADYVETTIRNAWQSHTQSIPFERIGLQTVGDGLYLVTAGAGPYRFDGGEPVGSEMIGNMQFRRFRSSFGSDILQSPDGSMYIRLNRGPVIEGTIGAPVPIPRAGG